MIDQRGVQKYILFTHFRQNVHIESRNSYMNYSYVFAKFPARTKKFICIFQYLYEILEMCDTFCKEILINRMPISKNFRLRRFFGLFLHHK